MSDENNTFLNKWDNNEYNLHLLDNSVSQLVKAVEINERKGK